MSTDINTEVNTGISTGIEADRGRRFAVMGAATAMFMVGTLAAVSDVIGGYPIYGGQAMRYTLAAAVLLAVARVKGLGPVRLTRGRPAHPGGDSAQRSRRLPGGLGRVRPSRRRARGIDVVRLTLREWVLLGALSLTGLVLFNVCVIEATRESGPSLVGTILGTVPLALAVIAPLTTGMRGRELPPEVRSGNAVSRSARPPRVRSGPSPRVIGAALIVVAGATLATGLGTGSTRGLLWSLGALACEVCFSLLALPLLPKLGPIRVSAYSAALAVPFLLVIGLISDGLAMLRVPALAETLGLGYLALIVTTVAFFLWYSALPRLGADRAGLFAGMIPVGAIVTTVVLGLGLPSAADLAGAAVVIVGIVLGLRSASR